MTAHLLRDRSQPQGHGTARLRIRQAITRRRPIQTCNFAGDRIDPREVPILGGIYPRIPNIIFRDPHEEAVVLLPDDAVEIAIAKEQALTLAILHRGHLHIGPMQRFGKWDRDRRLARHGNGRRGLVPRSRDGGEGRQGERCKRDGCESKGSAGDGILFHGCVCLVLLPAAAFSMNSCRLTSGGDSVDFSIASTCGPQRLRIISRFFKRGSTSLAWTP